MNNPQETNSTPGTKTDITNLTIDKFLIGLNFIRTKHQPVYRLATVKVTEEDKQKIKDAINLRNSVNKERGVTQFQKYNREDIKKVDEKGMTAEVMFSQVIQKIERNGKVAHYEVETPPIADKVLDKSKQDYVIKNPEQYMTFDVKGQSEDGTSLNVNLQSLARMKEQNADFMVAGLIKWDNRTIESIKEVTFYYVDIDFFERNSAAVTKFKNPNRTPFRALPLEEIKCTKSRGH